MKLATCICESGEAVKGGNRCDGSIRLVRWPDHGWVLYLYDMRGERTTFTPVMFCPLCGKEL